MFSYTDDAIVTSSPTGRHLSTVIRHPAGMPDDQWRQHAEAVCNVLNESDRGARLNDRVAYSLEAGGKWEVGPQVEYAVENWLKAGGAKLRETRRDAPDDTYAYDESAEYQPSLHLQQCGRIKRAPQVGAGPVEMMTMAHSGFDPVGGHYLELKGSRGSVLRRVFASLEMSLANSAYSAFRSGPLPIAEAQHLLFSDNRDALIESLERELADAHEKLKAPIKLPNRKSIDHYSYDQGANCNATGWNSCLESINALNPNRTFKRVE